SGPAGLSAAYDLIRMGYGVTIFEDERDMQFDKVLMPHHINY
ncbi:unnamed protein product, partial [marine sediment metagenome]